MILTKTIRSTSRITNLGYCQQSNCLMRFVMSLRSLNRSAACPQGQRRPIYRPDLVNNEFLKIFGQPERQTVCACERTNESNLSMAIQFFNGPLIYGKLKDESNSFRKSMTDGKSNTEIITLLYNLAVCRNPSDTELKASPRTYRIQRRSSRGFRGYLLGHPEYE